MLWDVLLLNPQVMLVSATHTQPVYPSAELVLPTHLSFDLLSDSDSLFSHWVESPLS